jgi:hypothetical protein
MTGRPLLGLYCNFLVFPRVPLQKLQCKPYLLYVKCNSGFSKKKKKKKETGKGKES